MPTKLWECSLTKRKPKVMEEKVTANCWRRTTVQIMLGSRHDNRSRFWSQGHLWHHAQCRNFSTTCHQIQFLTGQTHHPNHTNPTFPYHLAVTILVINFSKFPKLKISNLFLRKKTITEPNIKILVYHQKIYMTRVVVFSAKWRNERIWPHVHPGGTRELKWKGGEAKKN